MAKILTLRLMIISTDKKRVLLRYSNRNQDALYMGQLNSPSLMLRLLMICAAAAGLSVFRAGI